MSLPTSKMNQASCKGKCRHEACARCVEMSMGSGTSDYLICCNCYGLKLRIKKSPAEKDYKDNDGLIDQVQKNW